METLKYNISYSRNNFKNPMANHVIVNVLKIKLKIMQSSHKSSK